MTHKVGIFARLFSALLLGLVLSSLASRGAIAETGRPQSALNGARGCWTSPIPATVEEVGKVAENLEARASRQRAVRLDARQHALLLSGGVLKVAYGAGLVVGWGETGRRPPFAVVTAVGASALIAPFAFIGSDGDQAIADIFNCGTNTMSGLGRASCDLP